MQLVSRKRSASIVEDIAAGRTNPYTDYTEGLLCELVATNTVTPFVIEIACDRFVTARVLDILAEVEAGVIPAAHPSVARVLERAAALGLVGVNDLATVDDDDREETSLAVMALPAML
jgi:hypothetical protein